MSPLPATDATAAGPSEGGTGSQTANAEEGTGPQTANAYLSCFSCCISDKGFIDDAFRRRHKQCGPTARRSNVIYSYYSKCIFKTKNPLTYRHKKLKEDDIAICQCKYDTSDPESACVERCLNVLTNTECTPGYCQCGDTCENQIFQKREYAKTKLFRTNGRGWGLLADENIKAGQFIIEYCGEVISSEAAKKRSHVYEAHEVKDTYMISLDTNYVIDSTRKGNFARFLNHSCRPNCETRKWTVLGETRLGIFAMKDISVGMELTINYYFEWYAGATVRCLCGAANCCIFLGAKSQRFKEYNHVWKDGNDRYKVEPSNRSHKNYNIGSGSTTKMKSQRIPKWKKSRCTPKRKVKSSSRKQVIKGSTRRSHQGIKKGSHFEAQLYI